MLLRRTLLSLLILCSTTLLCIAHVHRTNGVEYDYTKSDAKSCCNNGDCRPAASNYYSDGTHYHFWVQPKPEEAKKGYRARWVKVPVLDVKANDLFGDRTAHWCGDLLEGDGFSTRCAFVPPKREMT